MTSQENSQGLAEITVSTLKMLRMEMQNVLDDIAKEHNITLKIGNASYSGKEATFKLHITLNNSNIPTREEKNYDSYVIIDGLPKRGTIIPIGNTRYKLVGFKSRSTKYPIIALDIDSNKRYKFPINTVLNAVKTMDNERR